MSLEEKNRVNRMLLSLLPSGCSPHEVIPLPDSIVRVLQENGARRCGGGDDNIEMDVQALSDDALGLIKDRVGTYLEDRARREEAPSQSKERVIRQSKPRSILSKAASKSIPSSAAPTSTTLKAASKGIPPRATPSLPTLPKPSESGEAVSEIVETAVSQSPPRSTPPTASPSLPAPPQPSGSTKSMSELLADAAEVMKKVVRRREIEKLRAAARREVEQMVRTEDGRVSTIPTSMSKTCSNDPAAGFRNS